MTHFLASAAHCVRCISYACLQITNTAHELHATKCFGSLRITFLELTATREAAYVRCLIAYRDTDIVQVM
jgi:hypothetical protein